VKRFIGAAGVQVLGSLADNGPMVKAFLASARQMHHARTRMRFVQDRERHCEPEAKQSRSFIKTLDCFVAVAPRNDGEVGGCMQR
jgi:hypothetical protein